MFINNFDPIAFQVFSFEVRWYSLAYIFGIIFGWLYCSKVLIKESRLKEIFSDYISYLIVGIIIGGRLGYVILYNFSYYINNPFEVLMIWNGGMSFHGALLGIIIVTTFFSRNTLILTDFKYVVNNSRSFDISLSLYFLQIKQLFGLVFHFNTCSIIVFV